MSTMNIGIIGMNTIIFDIGAVLILIAMISIYYKSSYKKLGIILILIGIGIPSVTFPFTDMRGPDNKFRMLAVREGQAEKKTIMIYEKGHVFPVANTTFSNGIVIEYNHILVIGIISVLVGAGIILLHDSGRRNLETHTNN